VDAHTHTTLSHSLSLSHTSLCVSRSPYQQLLAATCEGRNEDSQHVCQAFLDLDDVLDNLQLPELQVGSVHISLSLSLSLSLSMCVCMLYFICTSAHLHRRTQLTHNEGYRWYLLFCVLYVCMYVCMCVCVCVCVCVDVVLGGQICDAQMFEISAVPTPTHHITHIHACIQSHCMCMRVMHVHVSVSHVG